MNKKWLQGALPIMLIKWVLRMRVLTIESIDNDVREGLLPMILGQIMQSRIL